MTRRKRNNWCSGPAIVLFGLLACVPAPLAAAPRPVVKVHNLRPNPVVIFWLPDDGGRQRTGWVGPGAVGLQNTTIGHGFEVVDEDGANPYRFVVERNGQVATVPLPGPRPNILILMGDDWSWPHAGFCGDEVVRTPTVDALAAQGVVLEQAFVSAPSCSPSRFAVAAGQWHWRLGEAKNLGGSLPAGIPTYPELLQEAGYRIGFARKGAAPSKHHHTGRDPFGAPFPSFEAFIEGRQAGEPFCFWHGAGEPHRPYRAGTGAKQGFDPAAVQVPGCLPDEGVVRSDICDYYERIERFDRDAARMLAALDRSGETDNTIVVVSGDNGMPFPGGKATLYDLGTRVPLAIRWPRLIPGGRRVTDIVSLTDLAPTFLEAAGLSVPSEMTGRSMFQVLASARAGQVDARRTYTMTGMERHVYAHPARAIRTHAFLYIRNFAPAEWPTGARRTAPAVNYAAGQWPTFPGAFSFNIDPSPSKQFLLDNRGLPAVKPCFERACGQRPEEELYDLRTDPQQVHNVAAAPAYAETRTRLATLLRQRLQESLDPRLPAGDEAPRQGPSPASAYPVTAPPPDLELDRFYTKYVSAGGYPIISSERVSDYALKEAAYLVEMMLAKRPDVRAAMVRSGSRLAVMAHGEFTTDIPEHQHLTPPDHWDARARGLGGSRHDPICSCGEENLLAFPGDPYRTECILIHEFAHNIHLRGLVEVDPTFDERLANAYDKALAAGLWKGKYAAVNHHEYFAEGVQSWFNNNRENDHDHNHVNTREELAAYDPGLAALCREVFGDTELVYTKPNTRLKDHLDGYDPGTAPTFRWPKRLQQAQKEISRQVNERIKAAN